jgi:predicted alpha-1,2-mannosidase
MLRLFMVITQALSVVAGCTHCAAEDLSQWVDPLIGSETSLRLSRGNVYPAAARPMGMTWWSPQTRAYSHVGPDTFLTSALFYTYQDSTISGLRATHQANVWIGDYGAFSLFPVTGSRSSGGAFSARQRASRFRHETEKAKPNVYGVYLDDYGLRVEVAPTMRAAVLRVSSADSDTVTFIVDPHPAQTLCQLLPGEGRIQATTLSHTGGTPDNFAAHMALEFDRLPHDFGTWTDSTVASGATQGAGPHTGCYMRFPGVLKRPLTIKVGTSFLSTGYASANLAREVGGRSFDDIVREGQQEWNQLLGRVALSGVSDEQRRMFYTALYRSLLSPWTLHEIDPLGRVVHYSPYDGRVRAGPMYSGFGLWDSYRTLFPLFALLYPQRYLQVLEGLINAHEEGGAYPKWPSPGYREGMPGTQTEMLFADAWLKGLRDFDLQRAYRGVQENGTIPGDGQSRRLGLSDYDRLGFVPADRYPGAASRTLEFAYGDFCLAILAEAAGKATDAARFAARSRNWQHLFDARSGFIRGRLGDGAWLEPFDPVAWGDPYVEGSAWHYAFSVPHDVAGLTAALGGPQALAARLDRFFQSPPVYRTGTYGRVIHEMRELAALGVGQYAHGNQPGHHVPYLYNHASMPWKTQALVRHIVDTLYQATPAGFAGDEDSGSLSSWYVLSTLGIYPACPGTPRYELGAPRFERAELYLPNGKRLVIEGQGAQVADNRYVQSAHLNDRPLHETFVLHDEIVSGGVLRFDMGAAPNPEWYGKTPANPTGATGVSH